MLSSLLLILVVHGVFLGLVLLVIGVRRERSNTLLAILSFSATALLLETLLLREGISIRYPHLLGVFVPVWFLIGPLVYRYTLQLLGRSARGPAWHLAVAPGAVALLLLPFFVRTAAEKLNTDPGLAPYFIYCGYWSLTAVFAYRAWRLLRAATDGEAGHAPVPPWRLAWSRLLIGLLCIHAIADFSFATVFLVFGDPPIWYGTLSLMGLIALLYGIGVVVVMPEGVLSKVPWPRRSYARAGFSESAADALAIELQELMERDRPWLADDLGLASLAAKQGVSAHQLSQLLSQQLRTSFADYVNGFRVREACRLLQLHSQRPIVEIGFEAGFGSSASFYRAFKKHLQQTPSEYQALPRARDAANVTAIDRERRA